jgi:hypothetical protein
MVAGCKIALTFSIRRQKMKFRHWKLIAVMVLVGFVLYTAAYAKKSKRSPKAQTAKAVEVERKVKEAQIPEAALKTLKKMARNAKITEFAEEIEHGHTFYEGSWKTRSGANMDVLVTKAGALVEIEQKINTRNVPAAVLKAARKAAGKKVQLSCEKKTMILYEIKFRKGDSRHELLLTPDGRRVEEEVEKGKSEDDDDDDKDKKKGDDKGNNEQGDDEDGDDEDDDDEGDDDEDGDDEDDDDEDDDDEDGDDEDDDDEGDDDEDGDDEDNEDEDDEEDDDKDD